MTTPTKTNNAITRRTFAWLLAAGGLTALLPAAPATAGGGDVVTPPTERLTVHEWGTFTVLQDEKGEPIGGINIDDEPVPDFCHDVSGMLTPRESEVPPIYFKAIPRSHPDVWVRLETPVVYFYPPKGFTGPVHLEVSFRGGWLTQFYPDAVAAGPDVDPQHGYLRYGPLSDSTKGSLLWKGLKLEGTEPGPKTDNKAWLAPRNVPAAASVTTQKGERERYVFYRGVGHARAPLKVVRDGSTLRIKGQWGEVPRPQGQSNIGPLWLFDARPDGTCAYRTIEYVDLSAGDDRTLAETSAHFDPSEYSRDNLARIRQSLHAGLVRDGMYRDEADALLNTWEASYFKRPGLRLFFMVPRVWTDFYLPLTVNTDSERVGTQIERAMIGRIELVTPSHRDLLRRIAAGPASTPEWAEQAWERMRAAPADLHREEWYQRVIEGRSTVLEELGLTVPNDYRTYLALGRFRNALLNDELRHRPTDALQQFVSRYHLQEYSPTRDD